jgi:hypothetical protein
MYPLQNVTFQVVSEDLQSAPLQAVLLLDFEGFLTPLKNPPLWSKPDIPPGHFNDPSATPREPIKADFPFPSNISPGCHSATLAVSHEFKQELGTNKIEPKDSKDVALATWWFDIINPSDPNPPSGCVIVGPPTADAGVDGAAR